jgi:hypothetical protein
LCGKHYREEKLERGFVIEFGIEFWEKRRDVGEELVVGFGGSLHRGRLRK